MAKSRWAGSTWAVAGLVALGVVTAATAGLALTQHRPVAASPAPSAQPTVSVPAPTDPVVAPSPSATVPETTPSPSPAENDLPTIDVFGGFPESQSKVDALVEEDGSPNKEGSKLFAELVAAAFA